MKRIAIAFAGAAATVAPAVAWCTEGAAKFQLTHHAPRPEPLLGSAHGSWLVFGFYVINFFLFVALIVWFDRRYGGMTHNYFAGRARNIRETFARAEATLKQAEELAARARERAARLEADKAQLRTDIEAETTYIVDGLRRRAREAAERIVRDADLTSGATVEAARRRLRERLAEATGRLALTLVARSFTADDQTRLLQNFQARLSQEARQ